jgi:hypothetical protein
MVMRTIAIGEFEKSERVFSCQHRHPAAPCGARLLRDCGIVILMMSTGSGHRLTPKYPRGARFSESHTRSADQMRQLSPTCQRMINDLAQRHGFSSDAVLSMLQSVINGHGSMAQFNHPDFGGSGQWMRSGMIMVIRYVQQPAQGPD